jgi:hypothetical protein
MTEVDQRITARRMQDTTTDARMTWGLVIDVLGVLDRHGFQCPDEQHTGRAIVIIGELVRAYTGEDA